jgi:thymidine kinase
VYVVKHALDAPRHGSDRLVSRAGTTWAGARLATDELLRDKNWLPRLPRTLYAVDEAQFFDAEALLALWRDVVRCEQSGFLVAGLDRDYAGREWGCIAAFERAVLEASRDPAEAPRRFEVVHLAARCTRTQPTDHGTHWKLCNQSARFSQRLVAAPEPHSPLAGSASVSASSERVLIGGAESYQPACATCHSPSPLPRSLWFQHGGAAAEAAAARLAALDECTPTPEDTPSPPPVL